MQLPVMQLPVMQLPVMQLPVTSYPVTSFTFITHNSKNFKLKKFNGEQPVMSVTGTTIQAL
jgi:hypothetical protein